MRVGFAEIDITPAPGLELTGYGYWLDRRAKDALDPLKARAVVFQDDAGALAAIVQFDLLALSVEFTESIRARLADRLPVTPASVLLHCTHTHTGPAVRTLYGCGMPDPAFVARLRERTITVVELAASRMQAVRGVRWFSRPFREGFAWNRTGGVALDRVVRGVVLSTSGTPVCLLSYACHPVVLGRSARYSADYCGALIREMNAYGFHALYLNGCSGDVNPAIRRAGGDACGPETLAIYGRDLAAAMRKGMTAGAPAAMQTIHAESVRPRLDLDVPSVSGLRRIIAENRSAAERNPKDFRARVAVLWAEGLLRHREQGTLDQVCTAEVQVIDFGGFAVGGLAAETFTRVGQMFRRALAPRRLLIAATCNGVIGYIGDRRDVENGGYAATDACRIYGMPHPRPGAGEKWITEAAAALRSRLPEVER